MNQIERINSPISLIHALFSISSSGLRPKTPCKGFRSSFQWNHRQLDAITDVKGVEVGYSTIISGLAGENIRGKGPVKNGCVTAIFH